jgi:hypothetical protein
MRATLRTATTVLIAFLLVLSFCSANQKELLTISNQLGSSSLLRSTPQASNDFTTESQLKTVEDILEDLINSSAKINQEFNDIIHLNVSRVGFMSHCCFKASHLPGNLVKNRYQSKKFLPLDHNRVKLNRQGNSSDYINADYVDGYKHEKEFIAAQGNSNFLTIQWN